MTNDIGYDSKKALPNKLVQEDGTITDIVGREVVVATEAYDNKPALPNKFLNPDGSYSTLNAIIAEMVDNELFVVVEELPATGENNKIYMLVQNDKLIEYVWINNDWDPIGMVEFDIDNYYTKSEVSQLITASLNSAKAYADGLASNYDAAGAAASALQSAKDYANGLASNYDAAGAASTAESNAKGYADTKKTEAISSANGYTDTAIQTSITQVLGGSY